MKQLATLLIFYFTVAFCHAQVEPDTIPVNIAAIPSDSLVISKAQLFIDNTASLDVKEAVNRHFISLSNVKASKKIPPGMVNSTYYLKIFVSNESDKEIAAYIFPGINFTEIDLYKLNPVPQEIKNSGSIPGYKEFTLAAGEKCYILLRLQPLKNDINYLLPVIIKKDFIETYTNFISNYKSDMQVVGFILSGVLLMMILFMLTNYFISRSKEFLYNMLYSVCMFLLVYINSVLPRSTTSFTNLYFSYIDFFLLVLGTIFYIAFTRKFLNTKTNHIQLDRILKFGVWFILILLGIYTYLNLFTRVYLTQYYLENIMKFLILSIGIAFIYLAFKKHNRLFSYIAAGNAMLVFFSFISLALLLLGIKSSTLYTNALLYYYIGIVLELAFFLLGLTYKNRSELIRRIKEQESLKLEAEKLKFETQLTVIKAQQEERNRISADMHDDLGAGMTTIRLYSELAKNKLGGNTIPEIDKISSSANELLNKMNAIIWSMSSSNDSLGNMIAYIRSYALEYFEDTGVNCKITIPENLPNIEVIGEIRRNVFLVVKEALNNILKHANATEVSINLVRVEDGLTLYIHDNGSGIDFEKLRQFGNGLKNMKKRMQDIGIEFSIENNKGTLITLHRKIETF